MVGKYSKCLVSVICHNARYFSKFSDTVRREVLAQYLRAKNDLNKRSIKDFKRLFVFIYYNSFFCLLLPPVNSCSISLTETGGKFTSRSIFSARQNARRAFSSSSRWLFCSCHLSTHLFQHETELGAYKLQKYVTISACLEKPSQKAKSFSIRILTRMFQHHYVHLL